MTSVVAVPGRRGLAVDIGDRAALAHAGAIPGADAGLARQRGQHLGVVHGVAEPARLEQHQRRAGPRAPQMHHDAAGRRHQLAGPGLQRAAARLEPALNQGGERFTST